MLDVNFGLIRKIVLNNSTSGFLNVDMHAIDCTMNRREVSQPHFEGSARPPLTLLKMGLGSPPKLPKTQSAIARVKTPCIEVFYIPLERS